MFDNRIDHILFLLHIDGNKSPHNHGQTFRAHFISQLDFTHIGQRCLSTYLSIVLKCNIINPQQIFLPLIQHCHGQHHGDIIAMRHLIIDDIEQCIFFEHIGQSRQIRRIEHTHARQQHIELGRLFDRHILIRIFQVSIVGIFRVWNLAQLSRGPQMRNRWRHHFLFVTQKCVEHARNRVLIDEHVVIDEHCRLRHQRVLSRNEPSIGE
mmetsp:Transcript_43869/g.72465  ORF Transcript_43869/g.72465 Transcript_43869/m.72465 type:complete len:209 (+) Transcript_43869:127-753(+)